MATLETPARTRHLQRALYRRTKNDPHFRAYAIYDKVQAAIQAFIDAHHAEPKPFVWTTTADEILGPASRDLLNAPLTPRTRNL